MNETTSSTQTTVNSNSNSYPFETKAQIKEHIETDFGFACQVMVILFQLQTEHEQATSTTLTRNHRGFMSSHAVHGSRIARLIQAGEELCPEDQDRVRTIAPRYTKQLAAWSRTQALASNPQLQMMAAVFGV